MSADQIRPPVEPMHGDVWRIAAPLILSNVTVPLLGIVDTAVVGHLESPVYLGAVAIGATIFSFLYMGFNFLRMGTTGLAAQAAGSGSRDELKLVLGQGLITAVALAIVMIAAQKLFGAIGMALLDPEPDTRELALSYFSIRIWSAPAALANFVLIGWFIGVQQPRMALTMMLLINLINITLDLVFVVGLGWRADGVAAASVIAEYCGAVFGLAIIERRFRLARSTLRGVRWFDRGRLKMLFDVNSNLLVRTLTLMFAFGFITAQSARLGPVVLAANAVLLNLQYLMAYALDGFANAAEALVGNALGARDARRLDRAVSTALVWSLAVALAMAVAYLAFGGWVVRLMTDIEDVRAMAHMFLPWMIVSPLVSVWSFLYDGVYVGATRAKEMRNAMLFSAFVIYVPSFYLFKFLGNHGLWLAFMLFMAARGISMHWLWRRIRATLPLGPEAPA